MGKSLREDYQELTTHLTGFRKDLSLGVAEAARQEPGLRELLEPLLQAFDQSWGEVQQTMPGELTRLEKDVAALGPRNEELRRHIEDVERKLAEPPVPVPAPVHEPLPPGHGQTLRSELLQRFGEPRAAAAGPAAARAGAVQELTSGDWKETPPAVPPRQESKKPGPEEKAPPKPPGKDIGEMSSGDWK